MTEKIYLKLPDSGEGRWSISRLVEGQWVHLIQDSPLESPADAETTLRALNIPVLAANLDLYFPVREWQSRCPTLALLELCNILDPTNPLLKQEQGDGGM